MVSRREIEEMILVTLGQIRTMEANLSRRFGSLATARREARSEFHSSLQDLEKRANRLENLLDTLDRVNTYSTPTAA